MTGFRPVVSARGFWSQAGRRDHLSLHDQDERARNGVVPESWMGLSAWRARVKVFVSGRTEGPTRACPLCIVCEIQAEAQPESWTGLGLSRTREAFGVRKDEDTWSKPKRTGTAVRETHLR
jgi:hypothetical protein